MPTRRRIVRRKIEPDELQTLLMVIVSVLAGALAIWLWTLILLALAGCRICP